MPTEIILYGAGGHAKVVYAALRALGPDMCIRVFDDDIRLLGQAFMDKTVEVRPENWPRPGAHVHVAIGRNAVRERISLDLQKQGVRLLSVLHPSAQSCAYAQIGEGAFIAATAVAGPLARIGKGVIINHGAIIDHDCHVGDFSHIAPNATLGGEVRIGNRVLVGAGAVVLPAISIGDGAVIGAGAVVDRNVDAGLTAVGVPARVRP